MKRELLIGTVTARVLDIVPDAWVEWRTESDWVLLSVTLPTRNGTERDSLGFAWMARHIEELPDDAAEYGAQKVVDGVKEWD